MMRSNLDRLPVCASEQPFTSRRAASGSLDPRQPGGAVLEFSGMPEHATTEALKSGKNV